MALFTCEHCLYTFSAASMPESCPDCGKRVVSRGPGSGGCRTRAVRPATEAEIQWFRRVRAEIAREDAAARRGAKAPA